MIRVKRVKMAIWLVGMVALTVGFSPSASQAADALLPRVPKMVSELYLPEEQQAAGAAYRIYAGLPSDELSKLITGGRVSIDAPRLSPQMRGIYAAWFNSARWGCQPPAEKLDIETVAQSQLVFAGKGGIVDLCLQSPQKKIWKRVTIACSNEKAEWVRDGIPLLPSWLSSWQPSSWQGGANPPEPEKMPPLDMDWHLWRAHRRIYGIYAQLPSDRLRQLHQAHTLSFRFSDLSSTHQKALADSWDEYECYMWKGFGRPKASQVRPPKAVKIHFGITEVRISYMRSCPQGPIMPHASLQNFPKPYRVIYLQFNPLQYLPSSPGDPDPQMADMKRVERVFLVAWPAEVQRKVLAWDRKVRDWHAKWMVTEGSSQHARPGAPPYPKDPWGGTIPVNPAGGGEMRGGG